MGEIPGLHKRADFASLQGQMKKELKRTSKLAVEDIKDHGYSVNHPIRLAGTPSTQEAGSKPGTAKPGTAGTLLRARTAEDMKRPQTTGYQQGGLLTGPGTDSPGLTQTLTLITIMQ